MGERRFHTFRKVVWAHSKKHGRILPWRKTRNPYRILVSEVMLQQTQAERVVPKYTHFIEKFPTVESLASASLGDVLKEWSGLGYNRRAKMLHLSAGEIVRIHHGKIPKTEAELVSLPGIGLYTARAVMTFAYNIPAPLIETNIRTAYLFHFFPGREKVHDAELLPLIERSLDLADPRGWGNALMDYGAWLKQTYGNHSVRSVHHTKQSQFKGSSRELRGAVLRALIKGSQTERALQKSTGRTLAEVKVQVVALLKEGLVRKDGHRLSLP